MTTAEYNMQTLINCLLFSNTVNLENDQFLAFQLIDDNSFSNTGDGTSFVFEDKNGISDARFNLNPFLNIYGLDTIQKYNPNSCPLETTTTISRKENQGIRFNNDYNITNKIEILGSYVERNYGNNNITDGTSTPLEPTIDESLNIEIAIQNATNESLSITNVEFLGSICKYSSAIGGIIYPFVIYEVELPTINLKGRQIETINFTVTPNYPENITHGLKTLINHLLFNNTSTKYPSSATDLSDQQLLELIPQYMNLIRIPTLARTIDTSELAFSFLGTSEAIRGFSSTNLQNMYAIGKYYLTPNTISNPFQYLGSNTTNTDTQNSIFPIRTISYYDDNDDEVADILNYIDDSDEKYGINFNQNNITNLNLVYMNTRWINNQLNILIGLDNQTSNTITLNNINLIGSVYCPNEEKYFPIILDSLETKEEIKTLQSDGHYEITYQSVSFEPGEFKMLQYIFGTNTITITTTESTEE